MRWFDLKESFRMSRIAGTYGVKKKMKASHFMAPVAM